MKIYVIMYGEDYSVGDIHSAWVQKVSAITEMQIVPSENGELTLKLRGAVNVT